MTTTKEAVVDATEAMVAVDIMGDGREVTKQRISKCMPKMPGGSLFFRTRADFEFPIF